MPSLKNIKRRIGSVTGTQQIMKAMDLVATSKLQKVKSRLDTIRPLFAETKRMLEYIQIDEETRDNIYVMERDVKRAAYIIITSDRGLCGGYNTNLSKEALSEMGKHKDEKNTGEQIVSVGMKGWEYFRRRGKDIAKRFPAVTETVTYTDAVNVGELAMELFTSTDETKAVQEVYIAYTHFESMMTHVPRVEKILPLGGLGSQEPAGLPMNYEPSVGAFLEDAVPMYVNIFIYGAMMEAAACEQAARMISMGAAAKLQ